jgi:hypothetical protein
MLRRFLLLSPLVLLTLAVALWNSGCDGPPPDNKEKTPTTGDYWVDVSLDGLTSPFWGFVSNDDDEDFGSPTSREDALDPVNVIFWVDGGGSALESATKALEMAGWTQNDPCWGLQSFLPSLASLFPLGWSSLSFVASLLPPGWPSTLYAYFQASSSHAEDIELHYPFKEGVQGCQDKYHIRLFQPHEGSPWAIGAVHYDECPAGPVSGCSEPHEVVSWEGPEGALGQALESGGVVTTVCLGNTDGTAWRKLPNDGWATVVRLPGFGTPAGAGDKIDIVAHSLGCLPAP